MSVRNYVRALAVSLAVVLPNVTYGSQVGSRTTGYFVDIVFAASNGGEALIGNKVNPRAKEKLVCSGMFQAEGLFSVTCSSGPSPESADARIRFRTLLSRFHQTADLVVIRNGITIQSELTCSPLGHSGNPQFLATCH